MKKILSGIIASAIAFGAFGMVTYAADTPKFDVNGDGYINAKDATVILKMAVGMIPKDMRGDVNGDGYVNAKDATTILKYAVGNHNVTQPVTDTAAKYEAEVVRLVNIEREKYGLEPLTMDGRLNEACDIRANEVAEVFSHTRPNGTSCFTVFEELNIGYGRAAENIAQGYQTPEAVVNGWMNSAGHRANILNPELAKIGVGFRDYSWVQLFTD